MSVDLRTLQTGEPRTVTVSFSDAPGDSVDLVYDPLKYTARLEREAMEYQAKAAGMLAVTSQLTKLIVSWSLTADGKPAPIAETLEDLPAPILVAFVKAITADVGDFAAQKKD